jgi:hypothetical protein
MGLAQLLPGALAVVVQEASTKAGSEARYKIATGVIGIPAALLGLVTSYNILRKTTLESRKLEIEIQEKTRQSHPDAQEQTRVAMVSRSDLHRAVLLLIRFVILELTLRLWNVVPTVFGYATRAAASAFMLANRDNLGNFRVTLAASLAPTVIHLAFDVVYWVMVFGFGWPLLKDTCSYLGISVQSLLDLPYIGRWKQRSASA